MTTLIGAVHSSACRFLGGQPLPVIRLQGMTTPGTGPVANPTVRPRGYEAGAPTAFRTLDFP